MFHFTNLGQFGMSLQRNYADLEGYIPEKGDQLKDFCYPTGWFDETRPDLVQEEWDEFVDKAVEATEVALDNIERWRNENVYV